MTKLRWGVKKPFTGLTPTSTMTPKQDAEDILFENLQHLHEIGAITINDDEVLNESLLALARTGVITVNTAKSIQIGKKIQVSVRRLADDANKLRVTKELEDIQKPLSDALRTIAEIFKLQEEMMRRSAYISASGGLFIDRTYKYLRKQDRKKR
jgi:Tfp pilus assembly protein PilZ